MIGFWWLWIAARLKCSSRLKSHYKPFSMSSWGELSCCWFTRVVNYLWQSKFLGRNHFGQTISAPLSLAWTFMPQNISVITAFATKEILLLHKLAEITFDDGIFTIKIIAIWFCVTSILMNLENCPEDQFALLKFHYRTQALGKLPLFTWHFNIP